VTVTGQTYDGTRPAGSDGSGVPASNSQGGPAWWRATVAALLPFLLFACSPTYVLRAGYEEAKILWRRQPIERLLQDPHLDEATRSKLELALAVRAFAIESLHLRGGSSYTTYAQVDADQVVHVVTAAERFRLAAYTWWFPIVGRVPYKGYFSEAAAQAEASALEQDGYDTSVRPSVAFSTLGWFADPLLSTVLRYDRVTLADVIIHELLHNTTFISSHAEFDESFANFVGHRGAILFFSTRGDAAAEQAGAAAWDDALRFSDFLGSFAADLRRAYAAGVTPEERTQLFARGQQQFRALPWRTRRYDDFGTAALNNAVVLQYLMYADRLRLFEEVFEREADMAATIQRVLSALRAGPSAADPFATVQGLFGREREGRGVERLGSPGEARQRPNGERPVELSGSAAPLRLERPQPANAVAHGEGEHGDGEHQCRAQ